MDLILRGSSGKLAMIEIKYSTNAAPSKGFYTASEDLKPDYQYIIVPEGETWQRKETLKVSGLVDFLKEELPKL